MPVPLPSAGDPALLGRLEMDVSRISVALRQHDLPSASYLSIDIYAQLPIFLITYIFDNKLQVMNKKYK